MLTHTDARIVQERPDCWRIRWSDGSATWPIESYALAADMLDAVQRGVSSEIVIMAVGAHLNEQRTICR